VTGSHAARHHSPYEVAEGEEDEEGEGGGSGSGNQKAGGGANGNGSGIGGKEPILSGGGGGGGGSTATESATPENKTKREEDVCDLDLNDWIRISGGSKTVQGHSARTDSNPRSDKSESGNATISSSCSANERMTEEIDDDEWVLL
jgi:hypothetical protein